MNIYSVVKNWNDEAVIERFSLEEWEEKKSRINTEKILYVTDDVTDEKLLSYKIDKIIWGRVFDVTQHNFRKIFVSLSDDENEMQKEFEEKEKVLVLQLENLKNELDEKRKIKEEKRNSKINENKQKMNVLVKENDKDFPMEMNEMDALHLWYDKGLIIPPPSRISQIKQSYNMSWGKFAKFVEDTFGNKE